jgi:hypothetical protein
MTGPVRRHAATLLSALALACSGAPGEPVRAIPVAGAYPAPEAEGVAVGAAIAVALTEDLSEGSVTASSVTVSDGSVVAGTVTYDAAERLLTFRPAAPLAAGRRHEVTVSGLAPASGAPFDVPYRWSFTTADPPPAPANVQVGATLPPPPDGVYYAWLVGSEPYAVTWSGAGSRDGYLVERAPAPGGPFTTLATLAPAETFWVGSVRAHCETHHFRVTSTSVKGGRSASPVVARTFHNGAAILGGFPASTTGTSYTIDYGIWRDLNAIGPPPPVPTLVLQESTDGFATVSQQWTAASAWSASQVVTKSLGTTATFCYRSGQQGDPCFGPPSCITVTATTDNQAPTTPSGVSVSTAGLSAVVRWEPSTDNLGVAGYRLFEGGTGILDFPPDARSAAGPARPELAQRCYQLAAFDAAGNVSARSPSSCVTFPDLTPPTAPALSWPFDSGTFNAYEWAGATDDGTIVRYRVYGTFFGLGDPVLLDEVPGDVSEWEAWYGMQVYTIQVTAVDAYGNESPFSNAQ